MLERKIAKFVRSAHTSPISFPLFLKNDTLIWNMENPDLIKMRDQLEYMFLRVVVSGLRGGTLHAPQVKELAQAFLSIEPFSSPEDAHAKIDNYVVAHPEFNLLKEYADIYYDEDRLDEKLEVMRQHLKANNIDDALNVLNK